MPEIEIDGQNIYYHQPRGFETGKPTLLLIHGACQNRLTWEYQFSFLSSYKRFNSIAVDLPGHGLSGGDGYDSVEQYSDFILRFSEELKISELILTGHSMGGRISQKFIINHPSRVTGCLLAGTGPRIRITRAVMDAVNNDFDYFCRLAAKNSFSVNADDKLRNDFYTRLMNSNRAACLNDMRACNEFDVADEIDKISVPCVIVAGSDDVLAPVRYSRELFRHIKDSKLEIIDKAGHFMMMESSGEFNSILRKFLDFL